MNARVLILLALVPLGGCVTAGNFSGIWVNEKASPQKEVDALDGTWQQYLHAADTAVFYAGTSRTTSTWTDSDGNTWQKILSTFTYPDAYKGTVFTLLVKYSKNATVRESVWASPSSDEELKNPVYPSKIDPQNPNYQVFYRVKEQPGE